MEFDVDHHHYDWGRVTVTLTGKAIFDIQAAIGDTGPTPLSVELAEFG